MADLSRPPLPFDETDPRNDPRARHMNVAPAVAQVVMLIVIVVNAIQAGAAAIVGGPVLAGMTRFVDWDRGMRLRDAWAASFMGFFAYFVLNMLLTMFGGGKAPPTDNMLAPEMLLHVAKIQTVPLLACAWIIRWRMNAPYLGVFGYLRALLASAVSLMIGAVMVFAAGNRLTTLDESWDGIVEGLLGLSAATIVFALIGGVAASIPLWLGSLFKPRAAPRATLRRIYVTAVLVVLAWVVSTAAFEFLFATTDELYAWWKGYRAATDQPGYLRATAGNLQIVLAAFTILQLVAVGIAGSVVTRRLPAVFPGRNGWLRAVASAGLAIVAACVPAVVLGLALYQAGAFDDVAVYWR